MTLDAQPDQAEPGRGETFDGEFPFARPAGSDASMFIQWKGTDVCVDFICQCGEQGHVDGFFAYVVRCPACNTHYEMGTQVIARVIAEPGDRPIAFLDLA